MLEQDQPEQQQVEEHIQQVQANDVCEICRRTGFRGVRGVQIHQLKNALCKEMRRQAEARATLAAAQATGGGNDTTEQQAENGGGATVEQVVEDQLDQQQQEQAQPRSLIRKACAAVMELVWAIFRLICWILKISYSLMITLFGICNIYFTYLYLTGKTPVNTTTTFLLSPSFEDEFRVM